LTADTIAVGGKCPELFPRLSHHSTFAVMRGNGAGRFVVADYVGVGSIWGDRGKSCGGRSASTPRSRQGSPTPFQCRSAPHPGSGHGRPSARTLRRSRPQTSRASPPAGCDHRQQLLPGDELSTGWCFTARLARVETARLRGLTTDGFCWRRGHFVAGNVVGDDASRNYRRAVGVACLHHLTDRRDPVVGPKTSRVNLRMTAEGLHALVKSR
jgi:hypothetical protein